MYGRVDLQKMYAPPLERGWRHGISEWPVDVHVGSGTCYIPRKQCAFVIIIAFTVLAAFAPISDDIPAVADGRASESRVFKDPTDCNCDAVQPIAVFTPSDDAPDASSNSHLVEIGAAMGDFITKRTGQWIGDGACHLWGVIDVKQSI